VTDEQAETEVDSEVDSEVDPDLDGADDDADVDDAAAGAPAAPAPRNRRSVLAFAVLPAVVLALTVGAGVLKWQSASRLDGEAAAGESVAAARETTTAILSYSADSADTELNAARSRLTGSFLDAYTELINDVVIPGAKEKKISAVAQVPAAASVSAGSDHAVALVFVNQTVTVGKDAPTNTASSVRVTLDKVDGRWLVSGFDPV